MKTIRLCIVSHLYPATCRDYKGIFVKDLARALAAKGCEVHVVTPMRPGAEKEEVSSGVHVHRHRFYRWQAGEQLGRLNSLPVLMLGSLISIGVLKAWVLALRKKIHLFHAYWVVPGGFMAAVAGGLSNRPVVATAAGSDLNIAATSRVVAGFAAATFKRLSALVAVSRPLEEKASLLGMDKGRTFHIPGPVGIDMDLFDAPASARDRENGPIRILYAGNLEAPKRVDTLIRAAGRLMAAGVDFRFTIAGEGPLAESLMQQAVSLDLGERVAFKGRVAHDGIPGLLQSGHLFWHCSENEGLPVAIMEALAAGLPVLAAGVGGIPELVKDGETGFCLGFEDDKGFAEKTVALFADDALRRDLGGRARKSIVATYARDNIIQQNLNLYNSILERENL